MIRYESGMTRKMSLHGKRGESGMLGKVNLVW